MNRTARKKLNDTILELVCAEWDVTLSEILSKSRKRDVATARAVAACMMYDSGAYSYPMVARRLGYENHTSAIYAANKGRDIFQRDPDLQAALEKKLHQAMG